MHSRKRVVTRSKVALANARAKGHIDTLRAKLLAFEANPAGDNGYCGYCTHITPDRIGGAAITSTECGLCDTPMTFGNTNVDTTCPGCARDNGLCRHCAADIELKERRNPYPFQSASKSTTNEGRE